MTWMGRRVGTGWHFVHCDGRVKEGLGRQTIGYGLREFDVSIEVYAHRVLHTMSSGPCVVVRYIQVCMLVV